MKLKTYSIDEPNFYVGGVSIVRAANIDEAYDAFCAALNNHPGMKGRVVDVKDIRVVDDARGKVTILLDGNY